MISVVVPLLNEESSLEELYNEIAAALEPRGEPYEVVFVDDGSTDGSFSVLSGLHAEHANIVVVRLRRNFGKAAALQAGFLEAGGEVIVTIDADLQDDPAEIPQLLAKLDEGFDLVSGWKTRRNDPFLRRVFSRIFNWTTGVISGVRLHDVNCGLKAYRAEVVQGMRLYGELHRFIPVLAAYEGYRVAEIAVNHRARQHGRSRYGPERYLRGFFDLLSVTFMGRYRYRPLHLFGGIGLLMGAVGFIALTYLTDALVLGRRDRHEAAPHPWCAADSRGHPVRLARTDLRARDVAARGADRRAGAHRAHGRGRRALSEGRMKILAITSSYPRYEGDPTAPFIESIVRCVAALGHTVHVLLPQHREWARPQSEGSIRYHPYRYSPLAVLDAVGLLGVARREARRSGSRSTRSLRSCSPPRRGRRARCSRGGFDVVHVHWVVPNGPIGALAAPARASRS